MRLLREATEGRKPKRVWPMFVLVIAVVVGLAGAGVLSVEHRRQSQIKDARALAIESSHAAAETVGDPTDWNAWFRARLPESNGAREFADFSSAVAALDPSSGKPPAPAPGPGEPAARGSRLASWYAAWRNDARSPMDSALAEEAAAHLQAGDFIPVRLRALTRFENLNRLPKLENGPPSGGSVNPRGLADALALRIALLESCGRRVEAAQEAILVLRISLLLDRPFNSTEAAACHALQQAALHVATRLVASGAFSPVQLAEVAALRPAPAEQAVTQLLEGDVATVAQIHALAISERPGRIDRYFSGDNRAYRTGWFSWVSTRRTRRGSYDGPQRELQRWTAHCAATVDRLRRHRAGTLTLDAPDDEATGPVSDAVAWLNVRGLFWDKLRVAATVAQNQTGESIAVIACIADDDGWVIGLNDSQLSAAQRMAFEIVPALEDLARESLRVIRTR